MESRKLSSRSLTFQSHPRTFYKFEFKQGFLTNRKYLNSSPADFVRSTNILLIEFVITKAVYHIPVSGAIKIQKTSKKRQILLRRFFT